MSTANAESKNSRLFTFELLLKKEVFLEYTSTQGYSELSPNNVEINR